MGTGTLISSKIEIPKESIDSTAMEGIAADEKQYSEQQQNLHGYTDTLVERIISVSRILSHNGRLVEHNNIEIAPVSELGDTHFSYQEHLDFHRPHVAAEVRISSEEKPESYSLKEYENGSVQLTYYSPDRSLATQREEYILEDGAIVEARIYSSATNYETISTDQGRKRISEMHSMFDSAANIYLESRPFEPPQENDGTFFLE